MSILSILGICISLLDIIIIIAKYHSSNMNDVHTKSSYDIVSCPTKVVHICTTFINNIFHIVTTIIVTTIKIEQIGENL